MYNPNNHEIYYENYIEDIIVDRIDQIEEKFLRDVDVIFHKYGLDQYKPADDFDQSLNEMRKMIKKKILQQASECDCDFDE